MALKILVEALVNHPSIASVKFSKLSKAVIPNPLNGGAIFSKY